MTYRRTGAVLGVLAVVLTGACSGPQPVPDPVPSGTRTSPPPRTGGPQTSTPTPSAPSTAGPSPSTSWSPDADDDAAEGARMQVGRYFHVLDVLLQRPDLPLEELLEHATGEALRADARRIEGYRSKGHVQEGATVLERVSTGVPVGDRSERAISVQVCVDVSGVDVVDAEGESVVGEGEPPRYPMELDLRQHDGAWMVERHRSEGAACEGG